MPALEFVALGLQVIGSIFQVLGQPDEQETDLFDPDLKRRFEEVRGWRETQRGLMNGTLNAVGMERTRNKALSEGFDPNDLSNDAVGGFVTRSLGIKPGEGENSTAMHRQSTSQLQSAFSDKSIDNQASDARRDRLTRMQNAQSTNSGGMLRARNRVKEVRRNG